MVETGDAPGAIVELKGMKQVSDTGELEAIVDSVLAANPDEVEAYRGGKTGAHGLLRRPGHERDQGSGESQGRQRGVGEQAGLGHSCARVVGTTTPGGAVRRASHIVIALVVLAVLVLGHAGTARAMEEYPLESLLGAFTASVHAGAEAEMAEESGYVHIEFFNIADPTEPYVGRVHLGTVLQSVEPGGEDYAPLVTVTDVSAQVPVETDGEFGYIEIFVPVVSGDMSKPLPPPGHVLLPSTDYVADSDVQATLDNIMAQSAQTEEAAQLAVWYWTNGLDISDNKRAMELAGIALEVTPEEDDSGLSGEVPPTGDDGTAGGGTGDGGQGGEPWYDGSGSGGGHAPSRATVPPASTAAAGIAAAVLAAGAAAAGGGLSGLGSTAGAAGGGGSGGSAGTGMAPTRGAPGGAAGTAVPSQASYQPAPGAGIAPDGPAGTGTAPSAPPTPPPQQWETAPPEQPRRTRPEFPPPAVRPDGTWDPSAAPTETEPPPPPADDMDIDRGLYDPDYAGDRATPDPGMGVGVDPDSYDPWAAERNAGREAPASIGPASKEGSDPDITISPETGEYGVDFGGRGVRISKDRNGWNVGVGDRGVGPMDAAGVPEFDASAGGFSVSNRGGKASIGIGDPRRGSATIALDKGEGLTTVTIGDQNDRTIIKQVRDRYGVGRQFGSGQDPSRTIAGEYDTETGDFAVGQQDRRGSVIVAKEDDTVAVGWSSARGKPGPDDDFTRQISVDRSTGDFGVDWGKVSVSRDDDVFSVGSGKRGISWDTDTDSGILTFGPSDGSRQTTIGGGDGSFMAATRIPTRIGGQKIDIDVMVNQGMRWTANEDMAPELLTGGSEEYWVGIKHNWATIRTGRIDGDTQTWFTINRPLW